jgi:hypothetical protein
MNSCTSTHVQCNRLKVQVVSLIDDDDDVDLWRRYELGDFLVFTPHISIANYFLCCNEADVKLKSHEKGPQQHNFQVKLSIFVSLKLNDISTKNCF